MLLAHSNVIAGFQAVVSPQQGGLRLSGPPSGQSTGSGARTCEKMIPAYIRADSLTTAPCSKRIRDIGLHEGVKMAHKTLAVTDPHHNNNNNGVSKLIS
ncbi:hypothetical protein PoB_002459900 [Plakobranchus ocellatus]|uniref:Uncharacterized protein n=1 Tax=Plakobranchus ocellatus TaxID=259542 RepID=A0AAV3ZW18_9GAST|nr:hypothetical protein PoB_002459900 [Plakobranchus ocellatus]